MNMANTSSQNNGSATTSPMFQPSSPMHPSSPNTQLTMQLLGNLMQMQGLDGAAGNFSLPPASSGVPNLGGQTGSSNNSNDASSTSFGLLPSFAMPTSGQSPSANFMGSGNVSTQNMPSPAVLEQQIKLQQLQQLQQLQNQIFQQQMALISGQVSKPSTDAGQQFQQQSTSEHSQSSSSYLPTPGPSTELLPQQQSMEFVSPMILNNYSMDPDPNNSHSHTPSPMVTSTYHSTDEMFNQQLPPPMDSQSGMNYNHNMHRGIASAPEHLAFDIRSGREFDLDVSPLTSPWLGPYGEHSAPSSSSNHIRNLAHRQSHAHSQQHPDGGERMGSGSGNKRTASPSHDSETPARKRQSPAIRPTLANAGMPPPQGTSMPSRRSSSATQNQHRGSKSTTSTPLLRGTRTRSKSGTASGVQMMTPLNPAYDLGEQHQQQHQHQHVFQASNSGHSTDVHGSGGSGHLGGGGMSEDSPSPVDLSIPPPNSNGSLSDFGGAVPSNGGGSGLARMTPVTPASIMNLGRLGVAPNNAPAAPPATSTGPTTRKAKNKADAASKGLKTLLPAGDPHSKGASASNDNLPPGQKKTSHKAAEQKRRDSLKTTFDDLRSLLPPIAFEDTLDEEGNARTKDKVLPVRGPLLPGALPPRGPPKAGVDGPNKGVSKLQLLICGNSYIRTLKGRVERRDDEIAKLRREVARLRLKVDGREDMSVDGGGEREEQGDEEIDLEKDLDAIEGMSVRIGAVIGDTIDEEDEDD
ncbi:hypothetical protein BKA70DRAFT_1554064 [Coprinopsis sp. MPI-PUGE-AT-0042]|nr:hypothetical protein BKA70DRAFT_1554064 [Coprinopsis sp. MPI-PUGE-AT-0042]